MTQFSAAESALSRLPRATLGFFPTPFYRLDRLSEVLGINLWIKRDDFTGMNLFGGNKVRKLEYLLGDAVARGCDHVITYGATQSNHAMETVSGCRRLGLNPILYLTAVVEPDENDLRANLLLDRVMDAEIHIVDIRPGESEEEAEERSFLLGAARAEELTRSGHPCCDVPMGGANAIGSVGFASGYIEMRKQAEALGFCPEYLYHATGTGGTMAGLHAGRAMLGDTLTIRSITVSPKDESYLPKVEKLTNGVLEKLGLPIRADRDSMSIDLNYYAPGYEMPNAAATEAIKLLARTEGLLVDPVYTGKALAGLIDHARKGILHQGATVVFWHTGGATALFAEKEILGPIV